MALALALSACVSPAAVSACSLGGGAPSDSLSPDAPLPVVTTAASMALQLSIQTTSAPGARRIVDRSWGTRDGQLTLDALTVSLDRAQARGSRTATLVVRGTLGEAASAIHAAGLDLGPDVDLTQAYVSLAQAMRRGTLGVSVGKMVTLLGEEPVEPDSLPTVSSSNLYAFVENSTELGADVRWISAHWDLRARVTQGWDVVVDDNRSASFDAQVRFMPDTASSIGATGFGGPERPGDDAHWRSGAELVAYWTRHVAMAVQLDLGHEADARAGRDASWSGAGAWLTVPAVGPRSLTLRADVVDDPEGVRTSGTLGFAPNTGQRIWSATVTGACRAWPGVQLRPELRYDRSSLPGAFHGHRAQLGAAFGVTIIA